MNQLYPLKFEAILKEKIWGGNNLNRFLDKNIPGNSIGESWEISGIENSISVVKDGFLKGNNLQELIEVYMGDLVGDSVYDKFGLEFPLLIKYIDANDILSIQVHPDDDLAQKRHNSFGKTEMWYVIHAEDKAELISGFNKDLDKSTYLNFLNKDKLHDILNKEKVEKGDVFYIPSGRIHAIGKGIVLAEIQQSSDITYRIYDWKRKDANGNYRELHTESALDAIDYKHYNNYKTKYTYKENETSNVIKSEYFVTNVIYFDNSIDKNYNQLDSFVIYMCIEGEFIIESEGLETTVVKKGETVLIPAVIEHLILKPVKGSKLLEVYIPPNEEKD